MEQQPKKDYQETINDVGKFVVLHAYGKEFAVVQCPYCEEFNPLKHSTLKLNKAILCDECEQFFVTPASEHGVLHAGQYRIERNESGTE